MLLFVELSRVETVLPAKEPEALVWQGSCHELSARVYQLAQGQKQIPTLTRQKLGDVSTNVDWRISHEEEGIDEGPSSREDTSNNPNSDGEGWHGGVICGVTVRPDFSVWRVLGGQDRFHLHLVNKFDVLVGPFVNVGVVEKVVHLLQSGSREILIVFMEVVDVRDDVDRSFQTEVGDLGLHGEHFILGDIEITGRSADET